MKTSRWANRVFQFLLGITEVNCNMARTNILGRKAEETINFRYALGQEMITNEYVNDTNAMATRQDRKRSATMNHKLVSIEPYMTFKKEKLEKCKTRYIQLQCKKCQKRVRTYCTCTAGDILCKECFKIHLFDQA